MDAMTMAWLIGGGVLIAAEFIIPGGIVSFLGIAALLVGLGNWVGIFSDWISSTTWWFILSLGLLLSMRKVVNRFLPGESSYDSPDEDLAVYGTVVTIAETVREGDSTGRIHFRGTTWSATSLHGTLPPGAHATISHRENLVWIISPVDDPVFGEGEEPEA